MTNELRFDGRVAVVTGAGRGIGRSYARLLAARGASVVVNDLGGSIGGEGSDAAPAEEVVAEIVAAGGEAVADTHDVSTAEGAQALIDLAIDSWGRVDALINNAGIVRYAAMPDVDPQNLADHLAVHVYGTLHTMRAAWPRMVEQSFGRIVNTTSAGIFGLPANTSYAVAKAGVIGLTRSASLVGATHGIAINCIAPAAVTRMGGQRADVEDDPAMSPDLVAPMAAWLAHEDCPVTGEIYAAGAGRFTRVVIAETEGYVRSGGPPTIEDIAAHWDAINDVTSVGVPPDLMAWSAAFMSHLRDER